MSPHVLATCLLLAATATAQTTQSSERSQLSVRAAMPEGPLNQLATYSFTIELETDPATAKQLGIEPSDPKLTIPHPILQIDAPPSIHLVGSEPEVLESSADKIAFFLEMPAGRRLLQPRTEIKFRLVRIPDEDETIGLNLTAYLGSDAPGQARFVRQRLELPVRTGAKARRGDSRDSAWGRGRHLNIGQSLQSLTLPSLAEGDLSLSSIRGAGKIFLFTYRGQW